MTNSCPCHLKYLLKDLWVKLGSILGLDQEVGTADLLRRVKLVRLTIRQSDNLTIRQELEERQRMWMSNQQ